MNILFVLYGDFSSNSVNPLALHARELHMCGHSCAVAVPKNLETVHQCQNPSFRPLLYRDVLNDPESVFPDRRPADVIHAWTPREVVRRFVTSYLAKRPAPLVVYLEDHERWIACRAIGLDEATLVQQTEQRISERVPDALSHPFRYDSFIGLADAAVVIQDKLEIEVPPWVCCKTVMPGVDLEFFSPRAADGALRRKYGVADNERVIVYPGGLNGLNKPAIETLCRAIGLINGQGHPCRLLRAGPFALDFIDQLPPEAAASINDLGVLPRSELPDLLALADVFVQPGKVDPFEDLRLPGKLPELLAMGRPVVMPAVNIAHLFKDGVDAVLTRTGSAEEIAEKCVGLFTDPQQADRIGQAGRRLAEKYFAPKSQAGRMANVYKAACDRFDPMIAAEVWRTDCENTPVAMLLARKLKLLADAHGTKFSFEVGEILMEHARYIELMQRRVSGLETGIVERDAQIAGLAQAVRDKDVRIRNLDSASRAREEQLANFMQAVAALRGSISWRLTGPVRFVGYPFVQTRKVIKVLLDAPSMCGGYRGLIQYARKVYQEEGFDGIRQRILVHVNDRSYKAWIHQYDTLNDGKRTAIKAAIDQMAHKPLISVVMPVYNPPIALLNAAILSVRDQLYSNWELCIADDASPNPEVAQALRNHQAADPRIKVVYRPVNGHISAASNSAIELAGGDYIALLDHDDLLAEHALYWVADAINKNPQAKLIFSDEDKIDSNNVRLDPYFKCEFNYELMLAHNMITHLVCYQRATVLELGGFRRGYEGAQDYDLALRAIERCSRDQIIHIPRILYHWRVAPGSTAFRAYEKPYALIAAQASIQEHLNRVGLHGKVVDAPEVVGCSRVIFSPPAENPSVTIIIPTRDRMDLLKKCIDSIFAKTTYKNYRVCVIDNGSIEPETINYLKQLPKDKVTIIRDERKFDFSALNNLAVSQTQSDYICLMNNDIEVITPGWIEEMLSHAARPGVGCVGARLWYPDGRLQHGGVITGIAGHAGHSHRFAAKYSTGYHGRPNHHQAFSAVTAACLLVKRTTFDQVGGLDKDLKLALGDVDFCLRVQQAGYRNVWTPYAECIHYESASRGYETTPEKQSRFETERAFLRERWGEALFKDPFYSPNLTLDAEDFSLAWPPRV